MPVGVARLRTYVPANRAVHAGVPEGNERLGRVRRGQDQWPVTGPVRATYRGGGEEARVPRVGDLLYRFRPSGAPGSATAAGVPADRARDLAEELEPVFAALAPTVAECRAIRDEGSRQAAAIRARDAAEVDRVLATVAARAAAERARVTAAARAAGTPDTGALDAAGDDEVVRLRERVRGALPDHRRTVAASVEALLEETR
jgi:hypothetical protein